MGLLMISGMSGKEEIETVSCKHCQKVIKILLKGCTKEVQTKFSCGRCRGPICRACAEIMDLTGQCSPVGAKVDEALRTGVWPTHTPNAFKFLPS